MVRKVSATLALMVFALCLIEGIYAENSFRTVVGRALLGLVVTMVIGMILGIAIEKMLAEATISPGKAEKSSNDAGMAGR